MSISIKKPSTIICGIAVITFIAFAGLTTYAVNHLSSAVDEATIADNDGLPVAWSDLSSSSSTSSTTTTEIKDGYIAYLTSIENTDQINPISITHIASYLDGTAHGFVPLNINSLEYSYFPESSSSWSPVAITEPGESLDNFRLTSEIYLGIAGSSNSKVYFRYYLAPSESGIVNDKIAFVTESVSGQTAVTTSDSQIAYEEVKTTEVVAVSDESRTIQDDESGNSAFAEPLGETSEFPATIISASTVGVIFISPAVMTVSIIILVACLGIFAISLFAYLISRRSEAKRTRGF